MNREINLEDISEFQDKYQENENNRIIENNIKKHGILKARIAKKEQDRLEFKFNIEVPEVKIYNQLNSRQCNIYAFLRVAKDILRNNGVNVDNLDLSANFINFFDKLEKVNAFYNDIMKNKNISLNLINKKVNQYIGSFGTFHFCREIVNKYGLVTTKCMPEVNTNYDDNLVIELLKDKVKGDVLSLVKLSKKERIKRKKDLIYEIYRFLSVVYGNPPLKFKYEEIEFTPKKFKEHYLKDYLDNYITITPVKKDTLFGSYAFIPNLYLNKNEVIRYVPNEKLAKLIVKQLKEGVSVFFTAEESTTLDYDRNILDNKLYNIEEIFNIKKVSKKQKMLLNMLNYDHAMCITGALVEKGKIKQFKVDNSFGLHGGYKGRLIMPCSFLESGVITIIINKKYLS